MTLIQRLAREAAPCTGTARNYEPCGVFSYARRRLNLCEYCEIRPEIEAKMRELVEQCATKADRWSSQWAVPSAQIAVDIRGLLTDMDANVEVG